LTTAFGGEIAGGSGSLVKVGEGRLFLTNANTYSGGTTITGGKLVVDNRNGSGTGEGPVQVNAGRLGGTGIIAGQVTIGTGSGPGAALAPGRATGLQSEVFRIRKTLTFNADATYRATLNSETVVSDQVAAQGVIINGAAQFSLHDANVSTLAPGTSFTLLRNTSMFPISGTFANLPEGSTLSVGSNTFQVSYEGGDGNDMTLTVVP
jgi:autotransporter-associated beta strand protein